MIDLDALPAGWNRRCLGEVAQPSKARCDPSTVPDAAYIGLEHIEAHTRRILGRGRAADVKSTKAVFHAGDVLYGKLRPYLNKVAVPGFDGIASTDILVFPPSRHLSPDYLARLLNSSWFVERAHRTSAGMELPRTSWKALSELEVPVPPPSEQRAITRLLDQIDERRDIASTHLAQARQTLSDFRQSVLAAACSGRLTEDWRLANAGSESMDSWRTIALSEISTLVTSGSRGWARYYSDEGALFLRAQNISSDVLVLEDVAHVALPSSAEGVRTRVAVGDLLVTITGANVTKTAYVDHDLDEAYVNQHIALVRLRDPRMARYLHLWLIAEKFGRRQLLDSAYGAGRPGLNLTNVRQVVVELPPVEEQEEILRRVEALVCGSESAGFQIEQAIELLDRTGRTALAKAFRGELVGRAA